MSKFIINLAASNLLSCWTAKFHYFITSLNNENEKDQILNINNNKAFSLKQIEVSQN